MVCLRQVVAGMTNREPAAAPVVIRHVQEKAQGIVDTLDKPGSVHAATCSLPVMLTPPHSCVAQLQLLELGTKLGGAAQHTTARHTMAYANSSSAVQCTASQCKDLYAGRRSQLFMGLLAS